MVLHFCNTILRLQDMCVKLALVDRYLRYLLNYQTQCKDHMKISRQTVPNSEEADPLINVTELGLYIKRKRESERLSLRAVAKQTQVSASTLSRIENGTGIPDTPTLARLAKWLNIPFERIVASGSPNGSPIIYYPQESIPDIVEAHLRADSNLTPERARALAELFRVAYNQFKQ
jgi:transcriptional regulator with XRE-family HTH domain